MQTMNSSKLGKRLLLLSLVSMSILLLISLRPTINYSELKERCPPCYLASQTPYPVATPPASQMAWSDANIMLNDDCSRDAVLCGIDWRRSSLGDLIDTLDSNYFRQLFHEMTTPVNGSSRICIEYKRFGRSGDGGYEVCMSPPFKPTPKRCLVYSFGVNKDWSFDEAMAKYGCEVHSFDPSIGLSDHLHKQLVNFHNVGLWGSDRVNDRNWTLNKLSTIRSKLGHKERVIDVLKLDVEIAEWPFLRNVVDEDRNELDAVRQLMIEIHTPQFRSRRLSKQDLIEMLFYAKQLIARGFALFHRRIHNNCCGRFTPMMPRGVPEKCCQENFYVNRRFLSD